MAALDDIPPSDRASASAPAPAVRIWGLLGNRRGDNAMIEAAISASGLSGRLIQLRFNRLGAAQNLFPRGSLFSVRPAARAQLAPPWPDVVVTSGKRAVPAALWVKAASGGRTRLVHVGRPQAPLRWFDLVVTTPQYGLPKRPNVLVCRLPLTRPSDGQPAPSVAFAHMPRPWRAVIVGGAEAPQVLDPAAARRLIAAALEASEARGGALLVVTSPRTGRAATEAIRAALASSSRPSRLCAFGEGPNLYRDVLSVANSFLVTDDSVSMVAEAAATGRPVALFRLPQRPGPRLRLFRAVEGAARTTHAGRVLIDALIGVGLIVSNRDIAGYMDALERDGLLAGGESLPGLAAREHREVGGRIFALANA